jgi:hypothetical protein
MMATIAIPTVARKLGGFSFEAAAIAHFGFYHLRTPSRERKNKILQVNPCN